MPSTSETGHAKNVANFEDLISFCNGYGATYAPSKDTLTIVKLQDMQTQAKDSLQQAKTTKTSFDNATNTRQLAFKDLKPLATKVVNALVVASFLATRDATGNTAKPDSWLTIIVLDEQMNPVITNDGNNSYFAQVGGSGTASVVQYNPSRPITKNGYVYIYVSNELRSNQRDK